MFVVVIFFKNILLLLFRYSCPCSPLSQAHRPQVCCGWGRGTGICLFRRDQTSFRHLSFGVWWSHSHSVRHFPLRRDLSRMLARTAESLCLCLFTIVYPELAV